MTQEELQQTLQQMNAAHQQDAALLNQIHAEGRAVETRMVERRGAMRFIQSCLQPPPLQAEAAAPSANSDAIIEP